MNRNCGRRAFISRAGAICSAFVIPGCHQQPRPGRVGRIGFLSGAIPSLVASFDDEMQRLGYVPGRNVIIEKRLSRANTSDLAQHVAELAHMDLDFLVVAALPQALEVRKVNPNMPMVIATCPGMVSNGFANSLEHPGKHYTGMDELPPGVTAKRLEFLKTAAPAITRVALLSTTPGRGGHETQLADAVNAAPKIGVTVKPYRVASVKELESALDAIAVDGMNGLLNFQGGLGLANRELIVDFAIRKRLPAIYQSEFFVDVGGLMSWAPDQKEQYRMAARYADQILRGARPGDLPIRHPSKYFLSISSRGARDIGLVLPRGLLAQADHVR